jgi:hypothetical protein
MAIGRGGIPIVQRACGLSRPTTVSAGTLNVSSASGTIATLTVPTGGTVNLTRLGGLEAKISYFRPC